MECLLFGRVSARGGLSSPLPVVSPPSSSASLLSIIFFLKGDTTVHACVSSCHLCAGARGPPASELQGVANHQM